MSAPPPPVSQEFCAWHAESAEAACNRLGVDPATGLAADDAAATLTRYGPNQLASEPPRAGWRKFLDQFRNVLVAVLIFAAVLAGAMGDVHDAAVIAVVVLLNATLGFFQEHRAETALAALKHMLAPTARVRRDGTAVLIPAADLVPGDILLMEAGDRVAADARICSAHAAEVAEAALTGESLPVGKSRDAVPEEAPLAERFSMVYMNTVVTRGRLEAIVTATGMRSEMGKLAGLLAATPESATPLQQQLDLLGTRLAMIAGIVVLLILGLGLWRGEGLAATAMTALALAVAAIPEGLPAVVTVTLALGMQRMARQNAIVKKLAAVETLGCTTVICTDKTGTLTLNQMTARRVFFRARHFAISGEGYGAIGEAAAADDRALPDFTALCHAATLCADSRLRDGELIGDPTEGALLALAAKLQPRQDDVEDVVARYPRIAEIPFDSAHKFMATFHHHGTVVRMWVKGAPDVLIAKATRWLGEGGEERFDASARAAFGAQNGTFAGDAMRVLAVAARDIPAGEFDPAGDLMRWADDLTLIALVGIVDPPRPEVREAIRLCRAAGIAVKMITGDHRVTAAAIARDLGFAGEVSEGRELDGLDDEALSDVVERTAVFARVSPTHKLAIVRALQRRRHVVAMTGDGVNDAPALKTADIGIAMGITGTEVTKEAATLVLTDDNFASIVHAVEEGRTIYDNIVKFVRFQLSTNIGAMLTVICAPLFGIPTPLTAVQILWVNIIMDGPPAMTLGIEPARPGLMREPPRDPTTGILTGHRMLRLALYGLTMAFGTLAAYAWGQRSGSQAYAVTLAFTTFVLFQFFNIFNARSDRDSAFNRQFFTNLRLWLALGAVLSMQAVVVHWTPAQAVFDTVDLSWQDWGWAAGVASLVLLLEEGRKILFRHRGGHAAKRRRDGQHFLRK